MIGCDHHDYRSTIPARTVPVNDEVGVSQGIQMSSSPSHILGTSSSFSRYIDELQPELDLIIYIIQVSSVIYAYILHMYGSINRSRSSLYLSKII